MRAPVAALAALAAAACAAPAAAVPADPPAEETTFTVVATGDFLIHQPLWQRALAAGHGRYDFRPLFARVRPIVRRADLALCHVETPLQPGAPQGYPVFKTPPALARAARWAGWDACSTASNHTVDRGQAGVDSTNRALDRAGLRHTGGFSSRRASRRITMLRAKGVKVAFLAYTQLTNGIPAPHPWSLNMAEPGRILRDARRARRQGAQVVLVNVHWGDEYSHRPSGAQRSLARRLTRSPVITAIVGQHVHVVQPIRHVHGKVVVYGEGNLVSNQTADCCATGSQDGIIARLTIAVRGDRARVVKVRAIPTWVRHPDYTVLPVRRALRHPGAHAAELRASLRRTVGVVGWAAASSRGRR